MFEHFCSYMPDLYIALFSVSLTLAGLIAVFMVFRYQTLNNYVDSRKSLLKDLMEEEIREDPEILVKIQEIGKEEHFDYTEYFNEKSKDNIINKTVNTFVKNILYYRDYRKVITCLGFATIVIWSLLALFYIVVYIWFPNCNQDITNINIWCTHYTPDITFCVNTAISLFVISIVFTSRYLFISVFTLGATREKHIDIMAKKSKIYSYLNKLKNTQLVFIKNYNLNGENYRTWSIKEHNTKNNEKCCTLTIYEELIIPKCWLLSIIYCFIYIFIVKIIKSISICKQLRKIKRSVEEKTSKNKGIINTLTNLWNFLKCIIPKIIFFKSLSKK